jgi:carboxylesterase
MEAMVTVPGAEPWSAHGAGEQAATGAVVVHGITGNPNSTRPLGQRLAAEGFSVEVPLLPGHGTSHRDMARTRYADWVEAIEHVVEHLRHGCDHVVLVGHSMGGTICLDIASRHRDDVDGVAVINPWVLGRKGLGRLGPILQYVLPYAPAALVNLPVNDSARPGVDEAAYRLVPVKAGWSAAVELPRIRSQLASLTQPILIAWSPQDHSVPPENALRLRELVGSTDVTEVVCERSYHLAHLDYDAEKVETAVLGFVADIARS